MLQSKRRRSREHVSEGRRDKGIKRGSLLLVFQRFANFFHRGDEQEQGGKVEDEE